MTENTLLQNLRSFTVQIRRPTDDKIVGTGIAVSMDGRIVTCAHVVKAAIDVHPRDANGTEIGVYFPQVKIDEQKARRATVAACFTDHDDDVVLLQLTGGPSPLAPEQMPVLGTAVPSEMHPFRSYGYRRMAKYLAGHAHGTILGLVEPPEEANIQSDPVQLESKQINHGMSGAAVLDTERNLVVGIVSEFWRAVRNGIDMGTAWAIDAKVLSLEPLGLTLQDAPQPRQAAAQPQETYRNMARQLAHVRPQSEWHSAPPPLREWVGRADLLDGLTRDYATPDRRITGLIGFGGEGKSSLARRWVDGLETGDQGSGIGSSQSPVPNPQSPLPTPHSPTGLFWWGFYDNKNVDEFFEAALTFISGGAIDPRRIPSSSARAQVIAAMLANGRYLFVLDGLEVLQHQDGDEYGLLTSPDLNTFLDLFAAPGHDSFCLISSRAPILDLMATTSYTHRDVGPVTPADGQALLRALGVTGADEALDKVVTQWDGHALTLSLLGTFLTWQHNGDITFADQFDPLPSEHGQADNGPTDDVPDEAKQRYAHVHRVLRQYDKHLTAEERAFIILFSAFRTSITSDAFKRVFRTKPKFSARIKSKIDSASDSPQLILTNTDDVVFDKIVLQLIEYRLLRHNSIDNTLTTHPLVRNHYLTQLMNSGQGEKTHDQIKSYYLNLAKSISYQPTLKELFPLIEVVYHACQSGAYSEALKIYRNRLDTNYWILSNQLAAYDTMKNLLLEFFPDRELLAEPLLSSPQENGFVLNALGYAVMCLGNLQTSRNLYYRSQNYYKTILQIES